ncbi:MAG: hypothetical protein COZ18_16915 [Flexibacter sp. CG_4_10_14_3_um_filter_32_15]|nr:MAG: hypothetical protein COZ18_16915 [Flexibacter sp. CG_4_10_14_3_um_filter_32_15]
MKWIYHYREKWLTENQSPIQCLYLRPTELDEDGEKLVGKVIEFDIIALEYFMKEEFKEKEENKELVKIYLEELTEKKYYLKQTDTAYDETFLLKTEMYVKEEMLNPTTLFDWIKVYFGVTGIPFSSFEETDYNDFADTNALLNFFAQGAKDMEGKFGKEWWKKKE